MSTALGLLMWLPGWVLAIDAVRRPSWQWEQASRHRVFWVAMLAVFSPLFLIPYLVCAFPFVLRASRRSASSLYS